MEKATSFELKKTENEVGIKKQEPIDCPCILFKRYVLYLTATLGNSIQNAKIGMPTISLHAKKIR